MAVTVQFKRVFSAAHRLHNDPSKCKNIHGHNYQILVKITAEDLTDQNMIIPFDLVKGVIDEFDHALILDERDPALEEFDKLALVRAVPGPPSTEMMADYLAGRVLEKMLTQPVRRRSGKVAVQVTLAETANITAVGTRTHG